MCIYSVYIHTYIYTSHIIHICIHTHIATQVLRINDRLISNMCKVLKSVVGYS